MNKESTFQRELIRLAPFFKAIITPIPDAILTKERLKQRILEHRRPFDVVLFTKNRVACLELKVEYNKQMPHQKITEENITKVNPNGYFVVRRKTLKKKTLYTIEQKEKVLFETEKIEEIFYFFK